MRRTSLRAIGAGAIIMAGCLLVFDGPGIAKPAQNQAQAVTPTAAASLAALDGIERGEWTLTERGAKQPYKKLCLGDARQLLQVRHGGASCTRFVVTDTDANAVITYDCIGAGNGRTDLRVETPRLVQILSQGIASGAPFDISLEGRRTGICH